MLTLEDANGEPEEDAIKDARYVMDVAMYDSLRAALHSTRNPVPPFPKPSEVSIGDVRAPTLYYIAGWLLHCVRRDQVSVGGVWPLWLKANSLTRAREADRLGLPHSLVTTRTRGGLLYASWRLFHLVWYVEQCYVTALTMETICVYGKAAVRDVHTRLLGDQHVRRMFANTFTPSYRLSARAILAAAGHADDEVEEVVDGQNLKLLGELLRMYMRMRGRDAVTKLTSRARLASHDVNALRSKLADAAASASDKLSKPVSKPAEPNVTVSHADEVDEFPIDAELFDAMCDMVGEEAAVAVREAPRGSAMWPSPSASDDVAGTDTDNSVSDAAHVRALMDCIEADEE